MTKVKENKRVESVLTIDNFKITNFDQYRSYALRTLSECGSKELNIDHMLSGIVTEIGEINDVFKKELAYKKSIDWVNVGEEWADQMWYVANASLMTSFKLERDEALITFFRRTNQNKSNIQITGIESSKILISSLSNKQYLQMYLNWLLYLAERLDINIWENLTKNILKLIERFGDKFSELGALHRDLKAERAILESRVAKQEPESKKTEEEK